MFFFIPLSNIIIICDNFCKLYRLSNRIFTFLNNNMKKVLIGTGGGDCPGLNAVIRGFVKKAYQVGT
jgi:6-phosphofructokinase 1